MITYRDIEKLRQVFATKDDLKNYATKGDFKDMESRMDLKYPSKDDLNLLRLEILNEIRVLHDEIAVIVGYRDDLEDHELRITKLENKTVT